MRSLDNMKQVWRDNNFVFTKEEQERYNELLELRRARVNQFYEEGRVAKLGFHPHSKPDSKWRMVGPVEQSGYLILGPFNYINVEKNTPMQRLPNGNRLLISTPSILTDKIHTLKFKGDVSPLVVLKKR